MFKKIVLALSIFSGSLFVLSFSLLSTPLYADEGIGMVTGSNTGTYIQFGKDIAAISHDYGINVIPKESKGSLDNIRRMSSLENAAFAIVQSDVLGYLSKSRNPKFRKYAKRLRLIYPFYNEEVHLFARKNINSLDDLNGKRVVVGPKSSGTNMTAQNILKIMGIQPAQYLNDSVDDGIKKVLQGSADAVFVVAGKPRKGFSNLFKTPKQSVKKLLQQVHFVPLNDKALLDDYVVSNLSHEDYAFINGNIPTVAVKALLVSFDFSSGKSDYYKTRCHQLGLIGQALRENINTLKTGKYHKKWKQVDLNGDMGNWKIDKCSHTRSRVRRGKKKTQTINKPKIDDDIECSLNGTC